MSGSRNRPIHNTPRALDEVRARRGSASAADGRAVGRGLEVDNQGRPAQRLGRAQRFDDRGAMEILLGGYLGYLPGSPERIVFLPGKERILVRRAVPTIDAVEAAPARVTELDGRLTAFLVNHDGRIAILETKVLLLEDRAAALEGSARAHLQFFSADGVADLARPRVVLVLDNTGGDVTVSIDDARLVDGQEIAVHVEGYDPANVCRLDDGSTPIDFSTAGAGGVFIASADRAAWIQVAQGM